MARAIIALGGNLGPVIETFYRALDRLRAAGVMPCQHSALYGSVAWPDASMPPYVNAAVLVRAKRGPFALLRLLKRIERQLGRHKEKQRYASRLIDLDLIVFARKKIMTRRLTLPHPRAVQRAFVRYPLQDLGVQGGLDLEKIVPRSSLMPDRALERGILWRKCNEVFNAPVR